jgi:hypothetical protein
MPRHLHKKPNYYKTECLSCDLIIGVRWERDYISYLPNCKRQRPKQPEICPFCEGTHLKTFPINENEYVEINQKWDFIVSSK